GRTDRPHPRAGRDPRRGGALGVAVHVAADPDRSRGRHRVLSGQERRALLRRKHRARVGVSAGAGPSGQGLPGNTTTPETGDAEAKDAAPDDRRRPMGTLEFFASRIGLLLLAILLTSMIVLLLLHCCERARSMSSASSCAVSWAPTTRCRCSTARGSVSSCPVRPPHSSRSGPLVTWSPAAPPSRCRSRWPPSHCRSWSPSRW